MTSDAIGAYTQSYLKTKAKTWVHLPENRWPAHWRGKYKNPVVPLVLSLYGHPESGGYWEAHCEKAVKKHGWQKVGWEWPSVFWHPEKEALLVIYVDDFKIAAKQGDQEELWAALRKDIAMDPPAVDGRFLGCQHETFVAKVDDVKDLLVGHPQRNY